MPTARTLFHALALSAALLSALTVEAQEAPSAARVVVLTNHADARIVPLLRAELLRLGLTVLLVDRGPLEIQPEDLMDAARASDAFAAFRVLVRDGRLDVWIADRVTGKISLRQVIPRTEDSAQTDLEIVVLAVELLRVSLMELEAPHETRGELAPPEGIAAVAGYPAEPAIVMFRIAGDLLLTGIDPGFSLGLDLSIRFFEGLFVGAVGRIPLLGSSFSTPEGRATITTWLLGGVLGYRPDDPGALISPTVGLGMVAVFSQIVAVGEAPYSGSVREHLTAAPVLTGSVSVVPLRFLHITLEALGGVMLRELGLGVAGREAAVIGPLVLGVGLGFELAVP